jgi:hypothetical protein
MDVFQMIINVKKGEESEPKVELKEPSTTDIPITNGTYSMRSKTALLWRAFADS